MWWTSGSSTAPRIPTGSRISWMFSPGRCHLLGRKVWSLELFREEPRAVLLSGSFRQKWCGLIHRLCHERKDGAAHPGSADLMQRGDWEQARTIKNEHSPGWTTTLSKSVEITSSRGSEITYYQGSYRPKVMFYYHELGQSCFPCVSLMSNHDWGQCLVPITCWRITYKTADHSY